MLSDEEPGAERPCCVLPAAALLPSALPAAIDFVPSTLLLLLLLAAEDARC